MKLSTRRNGSRDGECMHWWKKWLLGTLAVLLGVPLLLSVTVRILTAIYHDIPPIDDSDLLVAIPTIANEQNAYITFTQLNKTTLPLTAEEEESIQKMIDGNVAWNAKSAAAMLQANMAALTIYDNASKQPSYQSWLSVRFIDFTEQQPKPHMQMSDLKRGLRLCALRAMYDSETSPLVALQDLQQLLHIANLLQENPPTLMGVAMSRFAKQEALDVWQWMFKRSPPSNAVSGTWWFSQESLLEAMRSEIALVRLALRTAYTVQVKTFLEQLVPPFLSDEMSQSAPQSFRVLPSTYLLQPHRSQLIMAETSRRAIAKLSTDCAQRAPDIADDDDFTEKLGWKFRPNALGRLLAQATSMSNVPVNSAKAVFNICRHNQRVAFVPLLFAHAIYLTVIGREPATLADLAPYLVSLPIDPLTNAPFTDATFAELLTHKKVVNQ